MLRRGSVVVLLAGALVASTPGPAAVAAPARAAAVTSGQARITMGWTGPYLNLWGWEVRALAEAGMLAGGAVGTTVCSAGAAKAAGPRGLVLQAVCAAVGAVATWALVQAVVRFVRGVPARACLQWSIPALVTARQAAGIPRPVDAGRNC